MCGSDTSAISGTMQTVSSALGIKEGMFRTLQILGTEKIGSAALPILILGWHSAVAHFFFCLLYCLNKTNPSNNFIIKSSPWKEVKDLQLFGKVCLGG